MPLSSDFSLPSPPTPQDISVDKGAVPSIGKLNDLTAKDLALYVGVPIATICVAGGIYYYYTKKTGDEEASTEETSETKNSVAIKETKKVETTEEESHMTPLEKAQALKGKGNKYFKACRFEQAINCYTEALEACPDDQKSELATFYQNRAAAHEQLKNWTDVINDATKAIELNPKYTKALARRAKAYEVTNLKRSALEDITAVCLLEGFSNQNNMLLADRVMKTFGKELAEKYYTTRPRFLPSSQFIKSYLDSFNEDLFVIEVNEEDLAKTKYAEISKNMKNKTYDDIVKLCTIEIDNNGPYKNLCLLLRGTMYQLMGENEKGIVDFDHIIQLETTEENKKMKIEALIKRGTLKMQMLQEKGCYDDLDEALAIDPDSANVYHHRGQFYLLTERLSESKSDFEKSIDLDSNFVAPRLQLAYAISKIGMQSMSPSMMNESLKVLEEASVIFPLCPEVWSLQGQLLQEQQRLDIAEEKLNKAISLDPQAATPYVYKGLLMLQWKRDIDVASKLIREAIRLDDKCDLAHETLATLEVQRGNTEEAIKLFERAIDLVRTENDLANTFTLLEAAKAQMKVVKEYGITLPRMPGMMP